LKRERDVYYIHYFDIYGRAESIKMLLIHAGKKYEDCRFEYEGWDEIKSQPDFDKYFEF
jgi:hypothetical protein